MDFCFDGPRVFCTVDEVDGDIGSGGGESQCYAAADAAAGTGDESDAASERGHEEMLYFVPMISLEDARWSNMSAGYRVPLDPRPLLKRLETDTDTTEVWHELWDELHHQGDVGEASYAAVPIIVESYQKRGVIDWNAYAIVAIIELARNERDNPDVPQMAR